MITTDNRSLVLVNGHLQRRLTQGLSCHSNRSQRASPTSPKNLFRLGLSSKSEPSQNYQHLMSKRSLKRSRELCKTLLQAKVFYLSARKPKPDPGNDPNDETDPNSLG